jgi:hypothetical protein
MTFLIKKGETLKLFSLYLLVLLLSLIPGCVSETPLVSVENSITGSALGENTITGPAPVPAGIDTEIPAQELQVPGPADPMAEYRRELELGKLQKSERRQDYSGDAVFANFREIRGGTIPAAVLYRSSHPAQANARAPYAARLAEQVRIAAVINLADNREELEAKASFIPWYREFITKNTIIALDMGPDYADPGFKAGLRKGLRFMLNHRGPYLIHCNDGNDRTGVTAALLEALAGAAIDEITDDYMLTYINYYHFSKDEERYRIVVAFITDVLTEFNGGKRLDNRGNIKQAAERYLTQEIGLTGSELDALKRILSGLE